MDINYLLMLQDFREKTGDVLTPLMEQVSYLAISFWPFAVFCFIYWVMSKKTGTWLLLNFAGANLVNGFLKLTACIYRPWIKDARVIPAGDAIRLQPVILFPADIPLMQQRIMEAEQYVHGRKIRNGGLYQCF